jgi:beta-mannosidase
MNKFFLILLMATAELISFSQERISLGDNWTFCAANDPISFPAHVPGNIFKDLQLNALIENPLLGIGEEKAQWVSHQDWEYHIKGIKAPTHQSNQRIILHLPEIDTYCDIYLNNQLIIRTDNAFLHWKVDITDQLKSENDFKFVFYSPYKIANQKLKQLSYPIPGDSIRAVTRKPQYEFGWDWGPKLAGCGIRQNPYFELRSEFAIEEAYIHHPNQINQPFACHIQVHNPSGEDYSIRIIDATESGKEQQLINSTHSKENLEKLEFNLKSTLLWGEGSDAKKSLRKIRVEILHHNVVMDYKEFSIAPRTIELVQEKDKWGTSFYFKLNGKRTFIKGANYIPIRYFHEQATEEDYRTLMERCKAANINMLRVWGGGIYEPDIFYNLCDEFGIMVWQDFMYACSMYPGDEGFLKNAKLEAEEHVKRLSHHPCMALWCGNNENSEGWERWGWKMGLSAQNEKRIQKAYNDLFLKTLPNAVQHFSSTPYWPSSPLWGRGDARSLVEGDSHYWGVWHDAENFEVLMTKIPRFMSEFGMQSYPSPKVMNEMCRQGEYHPKDPGILVHQKHSRGFDLMHQYMRYWHPTGETLNDADYGRLTQFVQAEGMTMGIEAQRRHSDKCGGTMFWQLNDVWPSFSWSAMDWHFEPKPFLEQLTYAYGPYLASGEWNGKEWQLYIINELKPMPNTTIKIQYVKDKVIKSWEIKSDIAESSQIVFKTKEIASVVDGKFIIECIHPDLPNGHYIREMKSKGYSESFMVPTVDAGHWSCTPMTIHNTIKE